MKTPPTNAEIVRQFEEEFTFQGNFGERKFAFFRVNNYTRDTPITLDDKVIEDLKLFWLSKLDERMEWVRGEIDKVFDRNIEEAQNSYKTAVNDQSAPYRRQLDRLLDIRADINSITKGSNKDTV